MFPAEQQQSAIFRKKESKKQRKVIYALIFYHIFLTLGPRKWLKLLRGDKLSLFFWGTFVCRILDEPLVLLMITYNVFWYFYGKKLFADSVLCQVNFSGLLDEYKKLLMLLLSPQSPKRRRRVVLMLLLCPQQNFVIIIILLLQGLIKKHFIFKDFSIPRVFLALSTKDMIEIDGDK